MTVNANARARDELLTYCWPNEMEDCVAMAGPSEVKTEESESVVGVGADILLKREKNRKES
jgi:hypothetical protein